MSFYGSQCWNFNHRELNIISTAHNKGLRAVWKLPSNSHRNIVYSVSNNMELLPQLESRFIRMFQTIISHAIIFYLSFHTKLQLIICVSLEEIYVTSVLNME